MKQEEPKQETLEEVAERYADIHAEIFDLTKYSQLPYHHNDRNKIEDAVEFGAKWQAERMYSEEEVFKLIDRAFHMYASSHRQDAKEWFEQFKKK